MKKITPAWLVIFVLALSLNFSCAKQELERLATENRQLQDRVASLEEISGKLDKLYSEVQKLNERIASLEKELETLRAENEQLKIRIASLEGDLSVENVGIEENRKKEEPYIGRGQYRVRSDEEAIREWISFRKNENKMRGVVTTWEFQRKEMYGLMLRGCLGNSADNYQVIVE